MYFKRTLMVSLAVIFSLSICFGCTKPDPPPAPYDPMPTVTEYQEDGRIKEPAQNIMESFDFGGGGFTESNYYISHTVWGNNNNGVKGENIGYTDDGIAVLKAYGDYTDKQGLKRSGACLLSRDFIGPGIIEVAMKVMPRLGGCSAVWPFYEGTNADTREYQYQEIDILEIPSGGNIFSKATFENVLNTNYGINWKEKGGGPMSSVKAETLTPGNDGRWHKYSVVWETSPKPRIRYYTDGVLTTDTNDKKEGEKTVSSATAPIQIGVWFPDGWAGDRDFEEAAALVDWITYMPFTEQPRIESYQASQPSGVYPLSNYPLEPIELPVTEYISNGDFENTSDKDYVGNEKFAWKGNFSLAKLEANGANGKALRLGEGESINQIITGVYGKTRKDSENFGNASYMYKYDFSGQAVATAGSEATVKIEFLDNSNNVLPEATKILAITKTGDLALQAESVNGAKQLRITVSVTKGSVLLDNLKMRLIEPKV